MSDRTLRDEIEIIEMCLPIRDHQGGLWFGHNNNFADATFVDYGACRAFAAAARALPDLVKVLERYMDAYPAFRIKPIGAPGSAARIEQENLMALEDAAKRLIHTIGKGKV